MPLEASMGASYGWRARIGFLTPSAVVENNAYEFYLMAPAGVTIAASALGVDRLTEAEFARALERAPEGVRQLAHRGVDALVQAGVPLIVTRGWGFEEELRASIAQVTNLPLATDIGACIDAMLNLGMRRVAMLTPFEDDMHEHLRTYVAHAGIEVVAADSIRTPELADAGVVPLAVPYRAALALARRSGTIDGIWITGALMPSVGIIEVLEQTLGLPVVSSMQAMAWAGLRLAGVNDRIEGYGRLVREF